MAIGILRCAGRPCVRSAIERCSIAMNAVRLVSRLNSLDRATNCVTSWSDTCACRGWRWRVNRGASSSWSSSAPIFSLAHIDAITPLSAPASGGMFTVQRTGPCAELPFSVMSSGTLPERRTKTDITSPSNTGGISVASSAVACPKSTATSRIAGEFMRPNVRRTFGSIASPSPTNSVAPRVALANPSTRLRLQALPIPKLNMRLAAARSLASFSTAGSLPTWPSVSSTTWRHAPRVGFPASTCCSGPISSVPPKSASART